MISAFSDFMKDVPDGPIGVAVSGGSDSVALLLLTADWARDCERSVSAVTVDHGLRTEAAEEAEGVAKLCESLGVDHQILSWDGTHTGNTQDAARRARQDLIGAWAKQRGLAAVATGHTRDDQAETFLLRVKRGSGVDGLSGMATQVHKNGVLWVRPILKERRSALRDFLTKRGVSWVDDPSNLDDRFDRVKIRKALYLLEETGISVDGLVDTADRMGTARQALETYTLEAARKVAQPREIGSVWLSRAAFAEIPEEVQLRLLAHVMQWVSCAEYRPRLKALKQALQSVLNGQAHSLSGCLIAHLKDDIVEVAREPSAVAPSDGHSGQFDQRWDCDPADGIWRVLGPDGLQKFPDWRDIAEGRNSLLASPSLWYNNELKSAPFVAKYGADKCKLRAGLGSFFSSIMTH